MSNWTFEEQYWRNKVELPLDIDHTCHPGDWVRTVDLVRERRCPACQYIRGFKDGQKHAE